MRRLGAEPCLLLPVSPQNFLSGGDEIFGLQVLKISGLGLNSAAAGGLHHLDEQALLRDMQPPEADG